MKILYSHAANNIIEFLVFTDGEAAMVMEAGGASTGWKPPWWWVASTGETPT